MNKLLMEENDRLQKQVSQLVYENGYYRQQTQSVRVSLSLIAPLPLPLLLHASPSLFSPFRCCACVHPSAASARTTLLQAGLATTDTSCESVVTSGHQNVAAAAPQAQPRDAGPAGYVRDPSPSLPASPCCFYLYFAMLLWLA